MIPYIIFFSIFFKKKKHPTREHETKKKKKKDLRPNKRHPKAQNAQWGALRGEIK
jgi:hypothetical protein